MKAYRGCRGMTRLILHRQCMEESGRPHASAALFHRKERRYTLAGRGIGPRASVELRRREMSIYSCRDVKPGSPTPWYYYTDCTSPAPLCIVGFWREMPLQDEGLHLSNMQLVHKTESLRSPYSIRERKSSHFMIAKGSLPCSQRPPHHILLY